MRRRFTLCCASRPCGAALQAQIPPDGSGNQLFLGLGIVIGILDLGAGKIGLYPGK